ncbi:hypothetical protein BS47DRAFT_1354108 [Hydnum rufescens UP504]|uniref:Uncharacterized protein n=1 Tax=Hydnum rufescens UP504 TaxID=1448309 RepID=A0A9P6AGD5_9AGAM|nr:hypothetical protein BS47DRAFT_1354108 [Hydnum rufescens UP504]
MANRYSTLFRNALALNAVALGDLVPQTPSLALILGAFWGLPTALWLYKCTMMVFFQRKIIYMGYVPTGVSSEHVNPNDPFIKSLHYEEVDIQGHKYINLKALALSKAALRSPMDDVILYLQGNAGNPLHRLPVFKTILEDCKANICLLAVAPRSYWKSSSNTPTETGLIQDYFCGLTYALERWPNAPIIVMGHSLGASVAICLLFSLPLDDKGKSRLMSDRTTGLIVENPFTSIPNMVQTLYASQWLPYHHLGRFVWDRWDVLRGLQDISSSRTMLEKLASSMLVLTSENDEIVPPAMGRELYEKALAASNRVSASTQGSSDSEMLPMMPRAKLMVLRGALHDNG